MKKGKDPLPAENQGKERGTPVLIYDGNCSICRGAVDWLRRRESSGAVEFLSCHDESLPSRFPFVDRNACLQAAHLVLPDGEILAGEKAAQELFLKIPGYRWVARLMRVPGGQLFSRVLYRWFARRRHAIASLFRPAHGKE